MIAFGHTAVGTIVGITTFNLLGQGDLATGLVLSGTAGVISHYLMDALPHGHFSMPHSYKKSIVSIIIFDLFLSIVIFLGAVYLNNGFGEKLFYILFGMGGSQLPDVIDGLIHIRILKAKGLLKIENNIHQKIHWHGKGNKTLLLGLRDIWQILVILFALLLVIFHR